MKHPEQQAVIEEAVSLLLHINIPYDDLTDSSQQRIWQSLEQCFDKRQALVRSRSAWPCVFVWRQRTVWQAAASLTGFVLIVGGVLYYGSLSKQKRIHTSSFGENQSVTLPDGKPR